MASDIAGRYAEALFQLSRENNEVEERKEEAEAILEALKSNPDLPLFFRAVRITDEEKKAAIDRIFDSFLKDTRSFLKLLVDKDRMGFLERILKEYVRLADIELGIENATVLSARPLDETQMKRIREALEKKSGRRINLKNSIDPSLIAGIKVISGATVTDVSVARQIQEMKGTLLKGGNA